MEALKLAWRSFEGSHPFHNYTQRALYHPDRHISRRMVRCWPHTAPCITIACRLGPSGDEDMATIEMVR